MKNEICEMIAIRDQLCSENVKCTDLAPHINHLLTHMDENDAVKFLVLRYGLDYNEYSGQLWTHRLNNIDAVPANMLFCDLYRKQLEDISVRKDTHHIVSKTSVPLDLVNDITYFVNRRYIGDDSIDGYIELMAAVCKEFNYDGPYGSVFRTVGENIRKYKRKEINSREALMDRYMEMASGDFDGLRCKLTNDTLDYVFNLIQSNFDFEFNVFVNVKSEYVSSIAIRVGFLSEVDKPAFNSFFEQLGGHVGNYQSDSRNNEHVIITFDDFTKLFNA